MTRLFRSLWRWVRGAFWFTAVMLAGLCYGKLVPALGWDTAQQAAGLYALALVLWPVVSGLRFRLRF